MPKEILSIHRFLSSQAFYPIALSTALAMFLYAGRIFQSDSWIVYRNLVWNLFLAWIPYLFSLLAVLLYQTQPHRWWRLLVPAGLWLLFFPNAPYIVTDFLHLQERPFVPLWYDIMLLSLFAWTGIFLAIASLRTFQTLVKIYMGVWVSWVFVLAALGLSGLGIYLGRFERWNSWDMLIHPQDIIGNVMARFSDPLDNIRFFGFTILFTLFLFLCYWIFISGGEMKDLREK